MNDKERDSGSYRAPRAALTLADFELLRRIGDGSYSHVVLAKHKRSEKEYALKIIDKHYIMRHKAVEQVKRERALLDRLEDPGIVQLYFTFQDNLSLYMGLEVCPNGELYDQIRLQQRLDEGSARFYAAEVVLMLEVLRRERVVHRDIKPENLMLDAEGHLKLIDFGSAKQLGPDEVQPRPAPTPALERVGGRKEEEEGDGLPLRGGSKRAVSLVGTADYVSPEVLRNEQCSCASDLWGLGCVVYQMLAGSPPFKSPSEYLTFQKILEGVVEVPDEASADARDLILGLLTLDPVKRLGAMDLGELKSHPFFTGVKWEELRTSQPPKFMPMEPASSDSDASSFDWELQSLSAALPRAGNAGDSLYYEHFSGSND